MILQSAPISYRREILAHRIVNIQKEIKRRKWLLTPEQWVVERLGENPWSLQREIMRSVVANRYTAVPSCFGSGKSWIAARLAAYWIDVHPPGTAFVVSTARNWRQVKAILWREIHKAFRAGKLPGRLNKTEWWLDFEDGTEEIVAFGAKPDDYDPQAFQGIHARYVLVIIDEAATISRELFEAATSLIVNEDSRMLAIGNPEDATGEFYEVCKPGSGWNVIKIRAWDTPNFSGEKVNEKTSNELISKIYVEEKRKKWGEANPMWQAKIEAEFPEFQENGLFPIRWVREAQDRTLRKGSPVEQGVDVGGGSDATIVATRWGPVVRITHRNYNPDTMASCGEVVAQRKKYNATDVKVDSIGIGKGLADRGKEQNEPFTSVNVAEKANDPEHYANLRAEAYWGLRERMEAKDLDLDPEDEDLAAQLVAVRYFRNSRGQIQIEDKKQLKKRLKGKSPDEMDAVVNSFMKTKIRQGALW